MAKVLIKKYRALHHMLPLWWGQVERQLWDTHTIHSQHGRKRTFYGRPSEILPDAVAFNPQCTVAQTLNMGLARLMPGYGEHDAWGDSCWQFRQDLAKYGIDGIVRLLEMNQKLQALGVEIFLQVHDAVGFQVPEQNVDRALPLIRDLMAVPIPISRRGIEPYEITIPVEIQIGRNWGEYDKNINPNGLVYWKEAS